MATLCSRSCHIPPVSVLVYPPTLPIYKDTNSLNFSAGPSCPIPEPAQSQTQKKPVECVSTLEAISQKAIPCN